MTTQAFYDLVCPLYVTTNCALQNDHRGLNQSDRLSLIPDDHEGYICYGG